MQGLHSGAPDLVPLLQEGTTGNLVINPQQSSPIGVPLS
jgi:hypothetical protein